MSKADDQGESSRRSFLKGFVGMPVVALAGGKSLLRSASELPPWETTKESAPSQGPTADGKKKFVAIQIGARSFVDEGVEKCLDTLQEKGGVNTLMSTVFTYGRGLAGRQVPGEPLPDHGVQEYDKVHGGSYTKVHPQFYANSVIKDVRAPDLGDFDIVADVTPAAKKRGMETYALFEEAYNPALMLNFEKIAEVDINGRIGGSTCFNNPNARNFLVALVEDWFKSNELDGMMWESERQGPLNNAIGAHFGKFNGHAFINCFCEYCVHKATEQGINVSRVREAYVALEAWVKETFQQPRANDGAFPTLWRLLLEYPEILAWERFWFKSQEEVYRLLYDAVKKNKSPSQGWLAHHAPCDHEPFLPRGTRLRTAGVFLRLYQAMHIQQLRWAALHAIHQERSIHHLPRLDARGSSRTSLQYSGTSGRSNLG